MKKIIRVSSAVFNRFRRIGLLDVMSDEGFLNLAFRCKMGKKLNLKNPQTFNEKLQWLKLYDRNPLYTTLVDKYDVKKYIADIIGEEYIVPTLGVWDRFDDIDFDKLPEQFVLKCTHDSGGLVICRDKSKLDIAAAKEKIERSLKTNYYLIGREWPYKDVRPRIIAEPFLSEIADEGVPDYKFFCFGGEPRFLYVSRGLEDHATAQISFFDFDGNKLPFKRSDYRNLQAFTKPENFEKMIGIAQTLAHKINGSFVRIDLYSLGEKIYFSEITFFPCSGYMPIEPEEWDQKIGSWIELPKKIV